MFSFFSAPDPKVQNFHPAITSTTSPRELFSELEPKDTEWACAGGFVIETQTWYNFLEDGTSIRIFNPTTKETTWKSINITNFVTPPPGKDKRSSKSDQFTVTHGPAVGEFAEQYVINANLGDDLQLALKVSRPANAAGFKVGRGHSYFGVDLGKPEGYVVHRFWPRTRCSGRIIKSGREIEANGVGLFVHAIQGMKPNLVAARWNFANFQSKDEDVSAIQMEFTTIQAYGPEGAGSGGVSVNIGGVVVGGKLVCVTGETHWSGETAAVDAPVQSRAVHLGRVHDPETGYKQPSQVHYTWQAPGIGDAALVRAELTADVGTPDAPKGLVHKLDVLGEIPASLRMVANYVSGTKPYIYQWLNPGILTVTGSKSLIPGGSKTVSGTIYNEATFISESD